MESLRSAFGPAILDLSQAHGETTVVMSADSVKKAMMHLRDQEGFEMLTDLTALDWLDQKQPRFEVVYHLHSYSRNLRLRVKAGTDAEIDTVTDVWPGAGYMERECWEMFGITFVGNPDLSHILLWDDFPGYPLRKDFHWREDVPLPDNR